MLATKHGYLGQFGSTPEEIKASTNEVVRRFLDRETEIAAEHGERYRQWITGQ